MIYDHCRIGSLETEAEKVWCDVVGSLPHRQLRKFIYQGRGMSQGSLPHRQLRNFFRA